MEASRGQWSSKIGFIFAAAGSAIGLGNIWRFPYLVGENGGAAFVVLYIFFVLIIGVPYMFAELALGRFTQRNPYGAINKIKPNSMWRFAGLLSILTGFGILSFYGVIAGWTFGYIFKTIIGYNIEFSAFAQNTYLVIPLFALFLLFTVFIVYGGVEKGIEKWSKILMPILFVLLIGLIIYSNSLDGSFKGIQFYLYPDFSKITGSTILSALGQAFFSLSLGMGLMATYGSYISKKENLVSSGAYIAFFDTMIAIMSGLIIFPALFAMGENPKAGPELIFVVFPELFATMPGGTIVGALFFILLSVAALTSTISLLEISVAFFIDEKSYSRKKIVWVVALVTFIIGLPSALSQGASEYFTDFSIFPDYLVDKGFLSQVSFLFGDFSLAFGAFLFSLFIGWVWGGRNAVEEIKQGAPKFARFAGLWVFMIRYFIPLVVFIILLNLFGIFN